MQAGDLRQLDAVGRLVAGVDVSGCSAADLDAGLAGVRVLQRKLDGLVTRIAQRSDALAESGRSAPAREALRGGGQVGSRQAAREAERGRVAAVLPEFGEALCAGAVSGEHADVLAGLTAELDLDRVAALDAGSLVADAGRLPVETFRRCAKRAVEAVTTDHGLVDAVAKREASEFRHWFDDATGMGRFAGSLDPERYETLTNAIDTHLTSLAATAGEPVVKDRSLAASALVDLVAGSGQLNARGRVPSVTVVVDTDTLATGPHQNSIRQTAHGHDLTPESVARLCCDAVLRKVMLDERGVPLAVGRTVRTATPGQWAALTAVHAGCAWEGCAAPISWCQAHHIHEWEHGGPTDLDNLVPLCSRHHHQVHEGQWTIKLIPDRSLKVYRPDGTHHTTTNPPRRPDPPLRPDPPRRC